MALVATVRTSSPAQPRWPRHKALRTPSASPVRVAWPRPLRRPDAPRPAPIRTVSYSSSVRFHQAPGGVAEHHQPPRVGAEIDDRDLPVGVRSAPGGAGGSPAHGAIIRRAADIYTRRRLLAPSAAATPAAANAASTPIAVSAWRTVAGLAPGAAVMVSAAGGSAWAGGSGQAWLGGGDRGRAESIGARADGDPRQGADRELVALRGQAEARGHHHQHRTVDHAGELERNRA